jgi:hypothetical protein
MQLSTEVRHDIRAANKIRLPWWGMLCVAIGSLSTIWLFDRLGSLSLFLPALNGTAVLAFAVAVKWKLRRHIWFWVTIVVVVALHIATLLLVPWTSRWFPAVVWAGAASLDFCVILVVIDAVGRLRGAE